MFFTVSFRHSFSCCSSCSGSDINLARDVVERPEAEEHRAAPSLPVEVEAMRPLVSGLWSLFSLLQVDRLKTFAPSVSEAASSVKSGAGRFRQVVVLFRAGWGPGRAKCMFAGKRCQLFEPEDTASVYELRPARQSVAAGRASCAQSVGIQFMLSLHDEGLPCQGAWRSREPTLSQMHLPVASHCRSLIFRIISCTH